MNSYRAPRRRPRRASVSFKAFGWVLAREAALRIIIDPERDQRAQPWRTWLATCSTQGVRRVALAALARTPERRYVP